MPLKLTTIRSSVRGTSLFSERLAEWLKVLFEADDYQRLRGVYQGKLESAIVRTSAGLQSPGALSSALNWYRALHLEVRIGKIRVPTLYIWGSQDLALGKTAAIETAKYVTGPYRFENSQENPIGFSRKSPTKFRR